MKPIQQQLQLLFTHLFNSTFERNHLLFWGLVSIAIFLCCLFGYLVMRHLIIRFLHSALRKTKNKWDDLLIRHKVFVPLALLVPAVIFKQMGQAVPGFPKALLDLVYPFVILDIALIFDRFLSAALDIYNMHAISHRWPIKGYVQIIKLFLYLAVGIIVVCYLLDQSPWALISGLGAMTALVLLIFKDTILSFVATIQIISNDLIRVGDWIQVPQFNADGDVVEIALYTIKVQNWDKTYTTIPTYKLMGNSFINWRGMQLSGARRIKRAIYIDQRSVSFCSREMLDKFKQIQILRDYIIKKERELEEYNRKHGVDQSVVVNGRRLTNLGTFRAYLTRYLRHNPKLRQDMTLMVRQLDPTPEGIPLEIYTFSSDTNWVNYEAIQADIFDHVLACVPEFGLRVFQRPSGHDLELLGQALNRQD